MLFFSLLEFNRMSKVGTHFSFINIDTGGHDRSFLHIEYDRGYWLIDILFIHVKR